jgi:hypothetical protein
MHDLSLNAAVHLYILGFLFLGGGAVVLGGALGFLYARSLLRFYILLVGGWIGWGVVVAGVLAATRDPYVHCEDCSLGLLLALAFNLLGWLFGLIVGGVSALFLRQDAADSTERSDRAQMM